MDRFGYDAGLSIDDADLERALEPDLSPASPPEKDEWWKKFRYDQYNWNDPEFLKKNKGRNAYRVIKLTQGYFMTVHHSKYKMMTQYPDGSPMVWCVKIDREKGSDRIVKIYARRRGRKSLGEPSIVYASRYVTGMLDSSRDIDHVNGWSLDNRFINKRDRINLEPVSEGKNLSNAFRLRQVHFDLKRGVERRGKNKKGEPLYGGSLRVRRSPKTVDCYRSKRRWTSQDHAHRWYLNQLKKRHRREEWAFDPATVNYPSFPPTRKEARRRREAEADASLAATF